jgi:hypothetical protein
MTTVFLSGSRSISRLASTVRERLDNIISKDLAVVVGDANGADKAMQKYLAEKHYRDVTVFHVGAVPRNNVGNWPTKYVETESYLKGWEYYANKDKQMAKSADFGMVLWDGESAGSIHNVFELLSHHKKIVIFFAPAKEFVNANETRDALELLHRAAPDVAKNISNKLHLSKYVSNFPDSSQKTFGF